MSRVGRGSARPYNRGMGKSVSETHGLASAGAGAGAQEFAVAAARIAVENKTENVCVLDLRGLSNLADYFVIGTGTSSRQMHAVLEYILEHARAAGRRPYNVADTTDASWLLADYVDVVIHLFDDEHRNYYDLDGLWGDAPRVELGEGADAGAEV
jgi:ribosome-associated protein